MGFIFNEYKKRLVHRYDDDNTLKYFTAADFKDLKFNDYRFISGNNELYGCFYYYDKNPNNNLVIFCHGLGIGHLAYMTEIERLCRLGFKVFTYDMTGCSRSQGKDVVCAGQFLADLDNAITSLKKDGLYNVFNHVYVMGHSLGGYAAGNILNFHKDIDKIVVISGFASIREMFPKWYMKGIRRYEESIYPEYFNCDAAETLAKCKIPVLIIQSTDDTVSPFRRGLEYIRKRIDNPNVEFMVFRNKNHNPNYTEDAVLYMNTILKQMKRNPDILKTVDWKRITEQDEVFWQKIKEMLC